MVLVVYLFFFFFNDTATTEIYTLSLHDALPILHPVHDERRIEHAKADPEHADAQEVRDELPGRRLGEPEPEHRLDKHAHRGDRKSTRLNSSHSQISYAVFCLKKKKNTHPTRCSI